MAIMSVNVVIIMNTVLFLDKFHINPFYFKNSGKFHINPFILEIQPVSSLTIMYVYVLFFLPAKYPLIPETVGIKVIFRWKCITRAVYVSENYFSWSKYHIIQCVSKIRQVNFLCLFFASHLLCFTFFCKPPLVFLKILVSNSYSLKCVLHAQFMRIEVIF